ncbi:tyrosine-type recombinase/integrase [Zobellella denitrificans]
MWTAQEIKGLKPKARQYEVFENSRQRGVGRLGVIVSPTGSKIFIFRFFWEGARVTMQVGKYPEMSLTQARDLTGQYGAMLKQGINPKAEAERQQQAMEAAAQAEALKGSVRQLFEGYTNKMQAEGKRTHKAVLYSLQKEAYPITPPDMKAKDVTPDHIKRILSAMIIRGAVVQSNRTRAYLMAAFNYGLAHDNDPANMDQGVLFGLLSNPVAAVPKQSHAEKPGQNWLKLHELRHLLDTFGETAKIGWLVGKLLELIVHCGGQRPYELIASRWDVVDWVERTLLVTPDISKNKRPHLIPLTDSALTVLREIHSHTGETPYIFPKRGKPDEHMVSGSMAQAVKYYREANPDFPFFTARDIRRTCKTLMGEAGLSKEIRDRIQNHALQDVSAKHYDRHDYLNEKRQALEVWEGRLNQAEPVANVVNLRG